MAEHPDPFAALEQAAQRQRQEEGALKALSQARCRLILGKDGTSAFFATLALRLEPVVDWGIDTLATDGKHLFLNPAFTVSLSQDELVGVVAHEVMHNALAHHARRAGRDPRRWNTACDLAVNPLLVRSGFSLPSARLMPGEGEFQDLPQGLSAEDYFSRFPSPPIKKQGEGEGGEGDEDGEESAPGEDGQGEQQQDAGQGSDPGGCGAVRDPRDASPASARQSEAEWQVAVAQAEQLAKQRGDLPGGLARVVEKVLRPEVDWRDVLRQFLSQYARNDFSWSRPNRRFLHQGLYLPGFRSEELGHVVLAVDTSGSIGQRELEHFAAEAQGILESFDCTLTVLYHDSRVQHVQTWRSSDGPLRLEPVGGGGTSHACVFDWVEAQGEEPTCVVCLTDLYTDFPSSTPSVPTLWAVVGNCPLSPPFGLRVQVGA